MKNKGLIWGAIASLFSLLLILPLCLGSWVYYAGNNVSEDSLGLFADWSNAENAFKVLDKTFPTFWAKFVGILAIIALVAGVLFVLLYVLDLTKVKFACLQWISNMSFLDTNYYFKRLILKIHFCILICKIFTCFYRIVTELSFVFFVITQLPNIEHHFFNIFLWNTTTTVIFVN